VFVEETMKRVALSVLVVLALMMVAAPAAAGLQGSVLPPPGEEFTPLPIADRPAVDAAQPTAPGALARTGFTVTTGAIIAAVLIVAGALALTVSRRRATS
jgi:hypothetical protein